VLFNAISARHQRRPVVITTNLAFGEWPKVFGGDEKLTTALLDRLAESATIITTRGKSFRTKKRLAHARSAPVLTSDTLPAGVDHFRRRGGSLSERPEQSGFPCLHDVLCRACGGRALGNFGVHRGSARDG
jgi:hypothetical protein